jgi:ACS family glucarate transporter-like MFS transporter
MQATKKTHVRYLILFMLFLVTTINYADRATIAIAGSSLQKDLGIDAVTLGYIFSAFGWAYVAGQIPGGWLLDRFGSKKVYAFSIFTWSLFTLLQGLSVACRLPGPWSRCSCCAFWSVSPKPRRSRQRPHRRGLVPDPGARHRLGDLQLGAVLRHRAVRADHGLDRVQLRLGARVRGDGCTGHRVLLVWLKTIHSPRQHPRISPAELEHIEQNGGLVDMDQKRGNDGPKWGYIKQLLTNRMLLGVYLGQYCINAITYFFLTWFPVYLVQERGMTILKAGFIASLPAICGFIGGVLGGVISDWLLRRGNSLTFSRKLPIVCGLLLSTTMVFCNYVDAEWMVVGFMALAFFGKGIGALGWAVVADTSPKQIAGLSGGLFNTFGNIASITTPIVIGYIISATGSFKWALVFVGANALVAVFSYLVIVGPIKRIELDAQSKTAPTAELAGSRH